MSSWKKATKINQKTHRERHQLEERKGLGLLEKKKDYKQRADHFNKRKKTLKILNKKILERNVDEYHTHMVNSKLVNGEHFENEKEEDEDDEEQKLLMDTQDMKYITSRRVIEKRKIDKIKSQMHMLDVANEIPNTHVFYVDNEKEAKQFDLVKRLDTVPELLKRKTNRLRVEDINNMDVNMNKKYKKKKVKQYNQLNQRIEREKNLAIVERKLQLNKLVKQSKKEEKPTLVKPGTPKTPPVYKWKYERKK